MNVPVPDTAEPRILRVLDASTSHLPEDVCENLLSYQDVTAYDTNEGFLLYVPADIPAEIAEDDAEPAPEPLLALWRYAEQHNCTYILLDRDADLVPGLPTYGW